jgi:uncharacterized iron-regulated protein
MGEIMSLSLKIYLCSLMSIFYVLNAKSSQLNSYQNHFFNSQGEAENISTLLNKVQNGDVILLGENHGIWPHHKNQLSIIMQLMQKSFVVDIGFEHIPYTKQPDLDSYANGDISEKDFLKSLGWKESQFADCKSYFENSGYEDFMATLPFDCYRSLIHMAKTSGGNSYAINVPRNVTNKIFRQGLATLTPEELSLLPPTIERGSESYFKRFKDLMLGNNILLNGTNSMFFKGMMNLQKNLMAIVPASGSHGPITEENLNNMFWAQSVWDEVMSWKSLEKLDSKRVFVVIVGDFHVAYRDGLSARFKARGARQVHEVSQIFVKGFNKDEINQLAKPHGQYGPRGSAIIITNQ